MKKKRGKRVQEYKSKKVWALLLFYFCTIALLHFLSSFAQAATYWVNPDAGGSNGQACNNSATLLTTTAKGTINGGLACLKGAGDVLYIVAKATGYSENIDTNTVNIPQGTSWNSPITFKSYGSGIVIIRGVINLNKNVGNPSLQYIVIDGTEAGGCGPKSVGACGIVVDDAASPVNGRSPIYWNAPFIRFTGVESRNSGNDNSVRVPGAGFFADGANGEMLNCSSHHNGANFNWSAYGGFTGNEAPYGVYWHAPNVIMDNCAIHNNGGLGIQLYSQPGASPLDGSIVRNSVFYDNGYNFPQGSSAIAGPYRYDGGAPVQIYNNVLYWTRSSRLAIHTGIDAHLNAVVYNNTIVDYPDGGLMQGNDDWSGFARNNIVVNNQRISSGYPNFDSGKATSNNNLCSGGSACTSVANVAAVNFVNPSARNYRLNAGSPAIGTGANLGSAYSPDIAGVPRSTSGAWDIGAYAYAVPVTPPAPQLVLALPLDEGSGTTATDVSGQKNNASFVGTVSWDNSGKFGKAIALDGSGYLNIPYAPSLALAPGMTLEAWVYPTAAATSLAAVINANRYYLYAASDAGYCPAVSLAPLGGYSTTVINFICATSIPPLNQWSHLAVTYDGATLTSYLNGSIVAAQPSGDPMVSASNPLLVGASSFGENFVGKIDQPMVYNYSRTPAQIVSDMNTPLIGGPGKYVEIAAPASVEISASASIEIGAD